MYMTEDGLTVAGTLRTVTVEHLQAGDVIISGTCTRKVLNLGPVQYGYQVVNVTKVTDGPDDWGYYAWQYLPGTPVLIIRPTQ